MSWLELLAAAEAIRADAAVGDPSLAGLPVVGVAWATVEADRAFEELASVVGGPATWAVQERDARLGARAWVRDPSPEGGVELLVVEPDTEGRLAAFLTRYGEGVGAAYLESSSGAADRVVALNPRWGPYLVVKSGAR